MDAHECGGASEKVAANEGDVLVVVNVAGVGDHAEFAKTRGKNGFSDAAHVAFVLHAVANEVGHRKHLQIVFFAEFDELGHAGHGAVFVHDFADDAGGA